MKCVTRSRWRMAGVMVMAAAIVGLLLVLGTPAHAAESPEEPQQPESIASAIRIGALAIGAALAIGLAGLATAKVQAAVGAGATGAMAEKPELFTSVLFLYAIPETIVVLGFVVAYLLLNNI